MSDLGKAELKTEEPKDIGSDSNNSFDLFNKLRAAISNSRDSYKVSLYQTKELISQKEEELKLLRIRQHKLEGAVEASDGFMTAVLPTNNKKI